MSIFRPELSGFSKLVRNLPNRRAQARRSRDRSMPVKVQQTSMSLSRALDAQADAAADAMLFGSLGAAPMTRERQARYASQKRNARLTAARRSPLQTAAKAGARKSAKAAPDFAKVKAAASAKKSLAQKGIEAFNDVFSGKASWVSATRNAVESIAAPVSKAYGAASQVAAAIGIKLPAPLEKEIAALDDKLITARKNGYIAQSYVQSQVVYLLRQRTPEADALASALSKAINEARDACSTAQTLIAQAKVAADSAKADILKGVIPAQALAAYGLRGRPANQAFDVARLKMQALDALAAKAKALTGTEQKSKSGTTADLARGTGRAIYDTAAEFGGKVVDFAQDTGETAEILIKKGGAGIKTAAQYANYLPILLIGGAVLYIVSVGRATGSGVGEMFKSAGRRIERT